MQKYFIKINSKKIINILVIFLIFISTFLSSFVNITEAAFNKQINYQGKLTTSANIAVSNGTYNMEFKLYDSGSSVVWTETRTGGNRVQVTSGLFSVMLGEVTALTSVNFDQTLTLGVNIGGTNVTPTWDGEMSPRKTLGAVPAAVVAETVTGAAQSAITSLGTLTGLTMSGNINLANNKILGGTGTTDDLFFQTTSGVGASGADMHFLVGSNGGTEAFTILNNGNIGIGATSPTSYLNLKAGTAAAGTAPLKFTSGTNLTTAEAGAMEWDGTNLFITQTTGPTRKTLAYTSDLTTGYVPYTGATGNVNLGTYNITTSAVNNLPLSQDNTDFNVKVGQDAGLNIVTGAQYNTFLGYEAGKSGSGTSTNAADFNTAVGAGSLLSNTTGSYNTASGYGTLSSNTTGRYNTAQGTFALSSNTTGLSNSAQGMDALFLNTTGSRNTAQGIEALYSNKANSRSTAIGYRAMTYADDRTPTGRDTFNTALGYESLRGSSTAANNTGQYNTAIGDSTLWSNTSGFYNVAIGNMSLYSNNAGDSNTASGYESLYSNTSGAYNVAMGTSSLRSNSQGVHNTSIGNNSQYFNNTGVSNTSIGSNSLYNNTTGNYNIAVGTGAGRYIGSSGSNPNQTSSYSVYIGYETRALTDANQNEIVIGNEAVGNGSNTATIGNSSLLRTYLTGVNLKAGTATAGTAPLKFTSGTLLGTTEAGAIEFNNDAYYGTITTGAGTAGARKQFAFTSDLTTGYVPYTGATGNVNLGTYSLTTPNILGGTGTTQDLTLQTTSGVGASGADMHFLVGNAGGTEAMTILNDGKVGVGTTSPADILHVVGVKNSVSGPTSIGLIVSDSSTMASGVGGGIVFRGKYTDAGLETTSGSIHSYKTNSTTGDYGFDMAFNTRLNGSTNTEKMRITSTGNVGIGNDNPVTKLDVKGLGNSAYGLLYLNSSSTNARGTLARIGHYSYWNMDSAGVTYTNWGARYDGEANQWVRAYTSANNYLPYVKYGTDSKIAFGGAVSNLTSDANPTLSDKVTFDMSNGNVGIGTPGPTEKIEVVGNIYINNSGGYLKFFNGFKFTDGTGAVTVSDSTGSPIMVFDEL